MQDAQQLKRQKAKVVFDKKPSIIFIVFSVLCMLMSIAFISMRFANCPISIDNATKYSGEIIELSSVSGKTGNINYIVLVLEGAPRFFIDGAASSEQLYNELKKIMNDEVEVLVNEKTETIIQITHNNTVLLNAEKAQASIYRNGMRFFWLGIVLFITCILFVILGFRNCFKLVREEKEYLK